MRTRLWSLVLAGGAGRRLASITGSVPKQFWSPDAGPTLLESTLDRTGRFVPPQRTVVVVDRTHRELVRRLPGREAAHHWLYQPCDRGTAAGVLIGLAHIRKQRADAIVVLTPSDQGVIETRMFERGIESGIDIVRNGRSDVVLFGVMPDDPAKDYGWIVPARPVVSQSAPVAGFVEKPAPEMAQALYRQGAVWNTMMLVARVSRLVDLYREHLPDLWGALIDDAEFADLRGSWASASDYESLPAADFSRDLIGASSGLTVYVWPATLGWSDLGTPERLARWHQTVSHPVHAFGSSPEASSSGAPHSQSRVGDLPQGMLEACL